MKSNIIKNLSLAKLKENWGILVLILMLFSVFIYQCKVSFGSVPFIVTRATFDDTFLYLEVARNWAIKGYPSFDGETITNGIQPLWGGFLFFLALFIKDNILFLKIALFICVILNILTAYPIYKIGKQLGKKEIGYLAVASWAIYLFLPKSILGMEASLNGLVFAIMIWKCFDYWLIKNIKLRQILILAILLTLNGFCRLDSGIISVFIYILFALKLIKEKQYKFIFILTTIPLISVSIYFLSNKLIFGALTPISGKAKLFWAHQAFDISLNEKIQKTLQGFWTNLQYNFLVTSGEVLENQNQRLIIFWILIIASLIYGVVKLKQYKLWLFIAIFVIMVLHTLIVSAILQQFAYAFWYYQPLRVVMSLGVGCIALLFTDSNEIIKYIRYILVGLGLLLFIYTGRRAFSDLKYAKPLNHFYMRRVEAGEWLDKTPLIADGAKIGAWNAGQVGFFSKKRIVVNLDGLVQNPTFLKEVLYNRSWRDYFRKQNIRYLVDYNDEDVAQTYKEKWDKNLLFRNIVPLSQTKIIKEFGTIEVLDISPWLESDDKDSNNNK